MTAVNWREQAKKATLRVNNIIHGKTIEQTIPINSKGNSIRKYAPHDGHLLYQFSAGTAADVDQAVASAREAFNDGRWSKLSVYQRKTVLNKLADLIEDNKDTFALYECLDVGKPISTALTSDVLRAAATFRACAEKADKLFAPSGADGGHFAYQRLKPIGVVGGIAGWNYPLSMAAGKVAPALIMGNSLVLKPSEFTPLSAGLLAELAIEAGVPPGVFNVVQGAGTTVGAALAQHPDVDLLAFVGSSATGKQLMISAGQSNMKRLQLECGGKSPFLVFNDCPSNLDILATDIIDTAFTNQGALCVAGTRLLIQEEIKPKLLPKILEQVTNMIPGDPLDPETTFGALINEAHMNKVLAYIDSGQEEGATLIHGGKRIHPKGCEQGFYIEPTLFDEVNPQQKIAQEEIFGPVLSLLTFKDEAEAIKLANDTSFGLAAYAATENLGRAQRLGQYLNAGRVTIIGSSNSSGGVDMGAQKHKESGFGYTGGLEGLTAYTTTTTVHIVT